MEEKNEKGTVRRNNTRRGRNLDNFIRGRHGSIGKKGVRTERNNEEIQEIFRKERIELEPGQI